MKQLAVSGLQSGKTSGVLVMTVISAPAIGKPQMMQGIRSKESAAAWGVREGYDTVYWLKAKERVYADKLTRRVDVLAEQIQSKSDHLVQMAEA